MSIEVRCPTCGDMLADKEILWITEIERINGMNISRQEKIEGIKDFLETLKIPKTSYCCKMRIFKSIDLSKIIK